MKKIILLAAAFLLLGTASYAYEEGDFQIWNTDRVDWDVKENWKLSFETEHRWGGNASEYFYNHEDIGVIYSGLAKWIDVGVNYRGIYQKSSDVWKYSHVPHFNVNLKTDMKGFKLSNRSRLELLISEHAEDKPRFRNKTTLKSPWKWTRLECQPYVADEIFINTDSVELGQNRLFLGLEKKIFENFKADLYYALVSAKGTDKDWNNSNVLGISLKLGF